MQGLSFEELVARTRADDRVVGLFLGGSRRKGANVRPDSDYDVRLVVTAPVPELDRPRGEHVDVGVMRLDRFRAYPEWDRYTLTRTKALIDKTGEIQRVIDDKGRLSEEETKSIPPLALDAYMNSLYRGLKRPAGIGGRLHVAESVAHLLRGLGDVVDSWEPDVAFMRGDT